MGLKDFFTNRKLKKQKANGIQNGTAYTGQNGHGDKNGKTGKKHNSKPQPQLSDDVLCALWTKCESCKELLYTSDLKKNLAVCKSCNYHHRLSAHERIELLTDYATFLETNEDIRSSDPLSFTDLKSYKSRLKEAQETTKINEAIVTGLGNVDGQMVAIAAMEFQFIGGSMGCVVGEKLARLIEAAIQKNLPLIIVSSSGGARMHEGILSLMQMAKTSAALKKLHEAGLLYLSILTEPTYGGVTASFSMLGDILIAEPKARIGFAGRRVIEETIRQKLPKDFQTAEYLLENGQIDLIIERTKLKPIISDLIRLHTKKSNSLDSNGVLHKLAEKKSLVTV